MDSRWERVAGLLRHLADVTNIHPAEDGAVLRTLDSLRREHEALCKVEAAARELLRAREACVNAPYDDWLGDGDPDEDENSAAGRLLGELATLDAARVPAGGGDE